VNRAAILTALTLVIGLPAAARAHALGAEAKWKAGQVTVEAFYEDDTPAEGATVAVTSADGRVVASGKTDTRGAWTFPAPPAGRYTVAVDAGAGHRTTVPLVVPDGGEPPSTIQSGSSVSGAAPEDGVTISDGATRSEFTGPTRLIWMALGLALIGAATWACTRLLKARNGRARHPGA
jgi:hypothetical protein